MKISSERVTLQRTAESDLPDLMKLWNDGRVMKWVGFPNGLGYDRHHIRNWFEQLRASTDRHHFVVTVKGIGFCGEAYYAGDQVNQRAGLDIKLIPEAQGLGIAMDALSTLINHVFEAEPGIEAVWTEPSGKTSPPGGSTNAVDCGQGCVHRIWREVSPIGNLGEQNGGEGITYTHKI